MAKIAVLQVGWGWDSNHIIYFPIKIVLPCECDIMLNVNFIKLIIDAVQQYNLNYYK